MVSRQLSELVREMEEAESRFAPSLSTLHENFRLSGLNLIH
jgi:hypothetical protein